MSNLKQFGLGMMMYVQDYDETYPPYQSGNIDEGGMGAEPPGGNWHLGVDKDGFHIWTWEQLLYPYTKSLQIFVCPSGVQDNGYSRTPFRGNYGVNSKIMGSPTSPRIKLSAIASPSETYAIMDAGLFHMSPSYGRPHQSFVGAHGGYYVPGIGESGADCDNDSTYADLYNDCERGRHLGGINMAFADGHVKWLKSNVVVAEAKRSAPEYGAWNIDQ